MATTSLSSLLRSSSVRWAVGGWSFFIAENVILSENRTFLIEQLGDGGYHAIYGTFSTAAMASIGYAYMYKIPKLAPPLLWEISKRSIPLSSRLAAWTFLSLGLTMASQTLPKLQVPVRYDSSSTEQQQQQEPLSTTTPLLEAKQQQKQGGAWKVQCPFDFTDAKSTDGSVRGLERVSRHPGLWSMGLVCLGYGMLLPSLPQRIWWCMPTMVAWIGGSHTDSRYRRSMGGTLTPEYNAMTSNVPFVALGQQGGWEALWLEMKPLNALLATTIATIWAVRRGRVPKSILASSTR